VHPPKKGEAAYLSPEQVLAIARAGQAAGCAEALFTWATSPSSSGSPLPRRWPRWAMRRRSTISRRWARWSSRRPACCRTFNPGLMDAADLAKLRKASVSMGIMLESTADRLGERGGPHFGAPDKVPALRLATLKAAGRGQSAVTSGILIGIGETAWNGSRRC
jgi:FO synthase